MKRQILFIALILTLTFLLAVPAAAYPAMENTDVPFSWDHFTTDDETNTPESAEETTAPPEPAAPQPLTYQVQSGDTLYKIASSFGIELETLTTANGNLNPRTLQIGQKLQIPPNDAISLPSELSSTVTQVFTATLTAYTAGAESTGKRSSDPAYGITYSGTKVQEGRTVAVDPSIIPIGSTLYIEGVGLRKAEDTGSAIHGKKIDVFIRDLDEAKKFGVKTNVNVYVLKSGGGSI